jgi:hypothetical protein
MRIDVTVVNTPVGLRVSTDFIILDGSKYTVYSFIDEPTTLAQMQAAVAYLKSEGFSDLCNTSDETSPTAWQSNMERQSWARASMLPVLGMVWQRPSSDKWNLHRIAFGFADCFGGVVHVRFSPSGNNPAMENIGTLERIAVGRHQDEFPENNDRTLKATWNGMRVKPQYNVRC